MHNESEKINGAILDVPLPKDTILALGLVLRQCLFLSVICSRVPREPKAYIINCSKFTDWVEEQHMRKLKLDE